MVRAEDIVFEISGNAYRDCYQILCRAVEIACEHFPEQLSMNELSASIASTLKEKKTTPSIARALARAVEDAWDNGGQATLKLKYGFHEKPSPKELIFALARHMNTPTEYRLWKQTTPKKYGIIARHPNDSYWMAVAPFLSDESEATAIVHALNQNQLPMEQFRKLIVTGTLPRIAEKGLSL